MEFHSERGVPADRWLSKAAAGGCALTGTWLYPAQSPSGWRPVTLHKMGAWFLLLIISFVLVTLVHNPRPPGDRADPVGLRGRRS